MFIFQILGIIVRIGGVLVVGITITKAGHISLWSGKHIVQHKGKTSKNNRRNIF